MTSAQVPHQNILMVNEWVITGSVRKPLAVGNQEASPLDSVRNLDRLRMGLC